MAKKVMADEWADTNPADLELRGCLCPGETIEDMVRRIREAIERYMEALAVEEHENRLSR